MRTIVICILLLAAVLFGLAVGLQQIELRADQMPAALIGAAAAVFALLIYFGSKLDAYESRAAWDAALKEDEALGCPPCNSQCGQGRNCPADAPALYAESDADIDAKAGESFNASLHGLTARKDPDAVRAQFDAEVRVITGDVRIDYRNLNGKAHIQNYRNESFDEFRARFDAESA